MSPRIEILVIGDEILDGTVTDSNSAWLGRRLAEDGVFVQRRQVVPDTIDAIVGALERASADADLIVTSGGLGPTEDDLTADAVAAWMGVELETNAQARAWIQEWRDRSGRMMKAIDERQARLPMGAEPLHNPVGTAPAFAVEHRDTRVVSLPGVPRELKELAKRYVRPWIRERVERRPARRTWKFFGPTESALAVVAEGLDASGLELHYRAHFPEIHLTAVAAGEDGPARLERFGIALRDAAGRHCFGGRDAELAEVVNAELEALGWTVATAESCTGGLIAQMITSVPGSSAVFRHGVVAYANEVKRDVLGVPQALLDEHGAVSEAVVRAMAVGVRDLAGADIGVATSGIAGPGGGTPDKPVGTVHIAAAGPSGVKHRSFVYPFERRRNRVVTAFAALALVRRVMSQKTEN